ncbi:N-6 DNA methylase [Streptomyces sp. NPDC002795]|uniref:N-6 DNA methylase n=1 Tax=Streptomyces sp. NPDC002795 TaxID=3364665 RepID=UPI00368751EE
MEQLDLFGAAEEETVPATFTARPAARPPAPPARPAPAPARPVPAPLPDPGGLFEQPGPALPAQRTAVPAHIRSIAALARNPRDAGQKLGEAVADTWHATSLSGHHIDIPVSIVAALALFPIKGHTADITRIITTCTDWELIQGFREVYAHTWAQRPDLAARMAPLMRWLTEDTDKDTVYAARRVTETAIRYGVLELTGDPDPWHRADTDLMSWTITSLRSHGARQGLGEYHTPPEVCDFMAAMTCDDPQPGQWFHEPAGGTGGMFRSLAQHLRHMDRDPADFGWALNELDPIAAAGAAVNAIVWGLGTSVLISCGDTLAHADLPERTARERVKLIEERDELVGRLTVASAYMEAIALADRLIRGDEKAA